MSDAGPLREVPGWIHDLIRRISLQFESNSVVEQASFGCEPLDDDGFKVWIGQSPVELEHGPHDGEISAPNFRVNIEGIRELFDWSTGGQRAELSVILEHSQGGSWLTCDGTVKGRRVVLVIPTYPAENARPDEILDTITGKVRRKPPPESA